jgi:hypothetical protein
MEHAAEAEDRGVGYGMRIGGFVAQPERADEYLTLGPLLWEDAAGALHYQGGQVYEECRGAIPTGVESRSFREVADSIRSAAPAF